MPRGGANRKSVAEKRRNGRQPSTLPDEIIIRGKVESAADLPAPACLEHDGDALDWWEATTPLLIGMVDRIDTSMMVIAAEAWSELRRCGRVQKVHGLIGTGSRGQMRPAASTTVQEKARATYIACTDRLGLNPQSRARIGVTIMAGRSMYEALKRDLDDPEDADADATSEDVAPGDCVGIPGA